MDTSVESFQVHAQCSLFVVLVIWLAAWSVRADMEAPVPFALTSSSFDQDNIIPPQFTCDGTDKSPALEWMGVPTDTRSFALLCVDLDSPGARFVHWVVYNIPGERVSLMDNITKIIAPPTLAGGLQARNSFGRVGYGGPCPPRGRGAHRYLFRLYALDTTLRLPAQPTQAQLESAMHGHVLAQAELIGVYQRN